MNKTKMAKAFNEWMRRYIENPKAFKAEFETVREYCHAIRDEEEPSYGEVCAAFIFRLVRGLE